MTLHREPNSSKKRVRLLLLCTLAFVCTIFYFTNQKRIERQNQTLLMNEENNLKADQKLPSTIIQNKRLATGLSHACMISRVSNVNCFGENKFGQVGADQADYPAGKMFVVLDISPATQIDTGWNHTCAIGKNDQLFCWGNNDHGQLGLNPKVYVKRAKPDRVDGLEKIKTLGMGKDFSCAVAENGIASCWGDNKYGQLGRKSKKNKDYQPQNIEDLKNVVDIDGGSQAACAVTEEGKVYCWGSNTYGQIGSEPKKNVYLPTQILELPPSIRVAIGQTHSCTLTKEQNVWCWGRNDFGQLGIGTTKDSILPQKINNLEKIVTLSSGRNYSCALNEKGEMYCWGFFMGDLENNSKFSSKYQTSLVPVRTNKSFSFIANISSGVSSDFIMNDPFSDNLTHVGKWGIFEPYQDEVDNKNHGGSTIELGQHSKFLIKNHIHFLLGNINNDQLALTCYSPDCVGEMFLSEPITRFGEIEMQLLEPDGTFSELQGVLRDINHSIRKSPWNARRAAYVTYKNNKNEKQGTQFGSFDGEFSFVFVGQNLKKHLKQIHWDPMKELPNQNNSLSCPASQGHQTYELKTYKSNDGIIFYDHPQNKILQKTPFHTYRSIGTIEQGKCSDWFGSKSMGDSYGKELDGSFPNIPYGILTLSNEKWVLYQTNGYSSTGLALIPLPQKGKKIDFSKVAYLTTQHHAVD